MALSAGTRLGPYEILEPLGAGGMGEVYRAHDPRLKRDVALKVLPAELASEPERLERFQREAETLAALNHPHIVTIFSVEEAEEQRFLTMELVEGKTLTKVIPRGGLPLSRFFQIAIPLTEAVSAAHERGIVHRDLKPGNVMVTEEDRVKVLDFGLAKLREGATGGADSQSPTEPATGPGRILGTAPYMSPEQVQGKTLDHRSDVFALGIMLYEMATGQRPFAGDTFADVASSILKDHPASVTERNADLPRDLGKLIKHCLEKEPRKRFQSTLDLANELEELRREVDSGEALTSGGTPIATRPAGGGRRTWLVGGAVVAALALAVGSLLSSRHGQPPAAPAKITPFTTDGGEKRWPALSPDGESVVYSWSGPSDDSWNIYLKGVGPGTRPIRLTDHSADEWSPTWSPDGRRLAFVRESEDGAGIYTMPSLGGQEHKLIDVTGPVTVAEGSIVLPVLSWSPDGAWLALGEIPEGGSPRIVRVSLTSGEKQTLTAPSPLQADGYPSFSPDGTQVAYVRGTSFNVDVWVQPVGRPGAALQLTSGGYRACSQPAWVPDGSAMLVACSVAGDTRVLRVSLNAGATEPAGGLGQNASEPSIRGRRMVYLESTGSHQDIWRVRGRTSPPADPPQRIIASSQDDGNPAYSPDGRKIAFTSNRTGTYNIWVCDSDGSHPVQLTRFTALTGTPNWSPDSRHIVFDSGEGGDWDLYVVGADGGTPRKLTRRPGHDMVGSWSRDGRFVYFSSLRGGTREIWKIPVEGGEATQVTRGGGSYAHESWDGSTLYFIRGWDEPTLWRIPVEGGDATRVVPGTISGPFSWAVSRNGLHYGLEPRAGVFTIQFMAFDSDRVTEVHSREEGEFFYSGLAVSPNEETILYAALPPQRSELMLVENFR